MALRKGLFRKLRRFGVKFFFNTILLFSIINTLTSIIAILFTNFTIGILAYIFEQDSNLCLAGVGVCALLIVLTMILFFILFWVAIGLLAMPELIVTNILAAIVGLSAVGLGVGLIVGITMFTILAGTIGFLFSLIGYTFCLMAYRKLWRITIIAAMANFCGGSVAVVSGAMLIDPGNNFLMPFVLLNFLIGAMMLFYACLFVFIFLANIKRADKDRAEMEKEKERDLRERELAAMIKAGKLKKEDVEKLEQKDEIFEDPPLLPGHWEDFIQRKKSERKGEEEKPKTSKAKKSKKKKRQSEESPKKSRK